MLEVPAVVKPSRPTKAMRKAFPDVEDSIENSVGIPQGEKTPGDCQDTLEKTNESTMALSIGEYASECLQIRSLRPGVAVEKTSADSMDLDMSPEEDTHTVKDPRENTRRVLQTSDMETSEETTLSVIGPRENTRRVLQSPEILGCTTENTGGTPISPVTSTPGSTPIRPKIGELRASELKKTEESLIESSILGDKDTDKTVSYDEYVANSMSTTLTGKSVVSEYSYDEKDSLWEMTGDCSTIGGEAKSCVANRTRSPYRRYKKRKPVSNYNRLWGA